MIADGEVREPFDAVDPPLFGASSAQRVFRAGKRSSKRNEKWKLARDDEAIAESEWIGPPSWSPNGRRLAYWTRSGTKLDSKGERSGGAFVLVVDGKNGEKWRDADELTPPAWSADSQHVAVIANKNARWVVLFDGEVVAEEAESNAPLPGQSRCTITDLVIDGAPLPAAYSERHEVPMEVDGLKWSGSAWRVVRDKHVLEGEYLSAGSELFSPDGKRFAYVGVKGVFPLDVVRSAECARTGDRWSLQWGLRSTGGAEEIGPPSFSEDGAKICYGLRSGNTVNWFAMPVK